MLPPSYMTGLEGKIFLQTPNILKWEVKEIESITSLRCTDLKPQIGKERQDSLKNIKNNKLIWHECVWE